MTPYILGNAVYPMQNFVDKARAFGIAILAIALNLLIVIIAFFVLKYVWKHADLEEQPYGMPIKHLTVISVISLSASILMSVITSIVIRHVTVGAIILVSILLAIVWLVCYLWARRN